MAKPKFSYFDLRARGDAARMLLHLANVDFEDHRIELKIKSFPPPVFEGEWADLKPTLPFKQVPVYTDEEVTNLAQSNTILRHIARKHNLYGKNNAERAYNDMYIDAAEDLANVIYKNLFELDKEETRNKVREDIKVKLDQLDKLLGSKKFFVGDCKLSHWVSQYLSRMFAPVVGACVFSVDRRMLTSPVAAHVGDVALFHVFENLVKPFQRDLLSDFTNLAAFRDRIAQIPTIDSYLKSPSRPKTTTPSLPFVKGLNTEEECRL